MKNIKKTLKTLWDGSFWAKPIWKKIEACTEELRDAPPGTKDSKLEELYALHRQLYTTE